MTELDLDFIKEHYAKMSDGALRELVLDDAKGIQPEVLPIIKAELQKRNFSPNLLKSVIIQNKEFTREELSLYARRFWTFPCPYCKRTEHRLNGTAVHTLFGVVFMAFIGKDLKIACPKCLDRKNTIALVTNIFFGWWSHESFFKTPMFIYKNIKERRQHWMEEPNETFIRFVQENIGRIELIKDQPEKLRAMLHTVNQS